MRPTPALIDSHRTPLGIDPSSSLSPSTPSSCDRESAAAFTGGREPLVEFKLFQDLPTELRLKIWTYALFSPRIVEVRARENKNGAQHRPVPTIGPYPLLRVCREARRETQKN